jgi:hypothetical protein
MGRRPTARHLEPCQDELRRRDSWRSGAREGDWAAGYASSSSSCWEDRRVEEELSEGDGDMRRARVRVRRTPVSPAPPFHLQGCKGGRSAAVKGGAGEQRLLRTTRVAEPERRPPAGTATRLPPAKKLKSRRCTIHAAQAQATELAYLSQRCQLPDVKGAVYCVGWLERRADNPLDGLFLIFTPYPPASAAATASQPAVAATFLSSAVTPPLLALSQLPSRRPSPLPCLSPVSLSVPRASPPPPTPPAPSRSRPPAVAVRRRRPSSRVPERPRAWFVPSQRLWLCGPRSA